jgi:hypothetical protein
MKKREERKGSLNLVKRPPIWLKYWVAGIPANSLVPLSALEGGWGYGIEPKTLNEKTMQHNVEDDILTKQCFPRAHR